MTKAKMNPQKNKKSKEAKNKLIAQKSKNMFLKNPWPFV